jgi:hypothetical protein
MSVVATTKGGTEKRFFCHKPSFQARRWGTSKHPGRSPGHTSSRHGASPWWAEAHPTPSERHGGFPGIDVLEIKTKKTAGEAEAKKVSDFQPSYHSGNQHRRGA